MTEARSLRPLVATALGLYLVGLAFILLVPWGEVPTEGVDRITQLARRLHAPAVVLAPTRIEFAANVLVIVPAVAAASWLRPRVRWSEWTTYGFLGSLGVEAIQAVFLPGRSATFVDVVANTLGALVGAALGAVLQWRRHELSSRASTG